MFCLSTTTASPTVADHFSAHSLTEFAKVNRNVAVLIAIRRFVSPFSACLLFAQITGWSDRSATKPPSLCIYPTASTLISLSLSLNCLPFLSVERRIASTAPHIAARRSSSPCSPSFADQALHPVSQQQLHLRRVSLSGSSNRHPLSTNIIARQLFIDYHNRAPLFGRKKQIKT